MKLRVVAVTLTIGIINCVTADWRDEMRLRFTMDRLFHTSDMLVTLGEQFDDMDNQQKTISVRKVMEEHAELISTYVTKISACVYFIENEIEALKCCMDAAVDMNRNSRNVSRCLSVSRSEYEF